MSSNATQHLSKDYIVELIACSLTNRSVLEVLSEHLQYHYLQTEAQKKIVKTIVESFNVLQQIPTIGTIAQSYINDVEVIGLLNKVKRVRTKEIESSILATFESFIKNIKFQKLYRDLGEMYNSGQHEKAYKLLNEKSEEIVGFSLKARKYKRVFAGFEERQEHRIEQKENDQNRLLMERLTTGIHEFDLLVKGGYRRGSSFCGLARSGMTKSTYLRWVALCNARLGKRVVLFQAEDTEEEAMNAFDGAWTSADLDDIAMGEIRPELAYQIKKVRTDVLSRGGEIIVFCVEQFDQLSIEACRDELMQIIKTYGQVDMVLFDYLEIFTVKGAYQGESGERRRRESIANRITSLSTEFKCVTGTVTQANDISPKEYNNPDFNLTRHNISEFKGAVKPFSYFFSLNATDDEYEAQMMRIHFDKFRKHKSGQTIKIYQSRGNGRFYDSKKTKELLFDENEVKY